MSLFFDDTGDARVGRMAAAVTLPILGIFLFFVFVPFAQISGGERGVRLTWGNPSEEELQPGLRLRVPIMQRVVKMNVQTNLVEVEAGAAAKDLNDANTKVAVNFHIKPDMAAEIYRDYGIYYADTIIAPAIQESVKATTAKFTAEELVTKRDMVKSDITQALATRLLRSHIIVDEVSITNFAFSPEFNGAIEAKVKAEQDALAAKNKLSQVEYEAKQKIATAQAEAEAIRIQAQAVNAQGGADYVKLQWILKWDGKQPTYMMGNSVPLIQIPQ